METMVLREKARPDGTIPIPVPEELREQELEVVVVMQPAAPASAEWPAGFLDRTYGSLKDMPLARLAQGSLDVREAMQ